jgi:hypothetical protein
MVRLVWLAIFSSRAARFTAGPNAGEVEPVAAADIAVENPPDMQGDTEAKPLDRVADRVLQVGHAGARLMGGFQHIRANLLFVADIFVDRENREQARRPCISTRRRHAS